MVDDRQMERLKWRSRRGLLELDLLFARFWQQGEARLAVADMSALDRLLQLPDNDILDMIMARLACSDERLRPLIQRLQTI
jgi:antitoxin CptB